MQEKKEEKLEPGGMMMHMGRPARIRFLVNSITSNLFYFLHVKDQILLRIDKFRDTIINVKELK